MDEINQSHPSACPELEKLAAAAATVNYSDTLTAQESTESLSTEQSTLQNSQYHPSTSFNFPRTIQYDLGCGSVFNRSSECMESENTHNVSSVMVTIDQSQIDERYATTMVNSDNTHTLTDMQIPVSKPEKWNSIIFINNSKQKAKEVNMGQIIVEFPNNDQLDKLSCGEGSHVCKKCKLHFQSLTQLHEHQKESHATRLRCGLSFEVKIEMIKRILAGEKQRDIAEEYNVNRSTVKSILKKSNQYLVTWKKGTHHPDSKRLKGAKREDIERALHVWYTQAKNTGKAVSGKLLCSKAENFAKRLGYNDFKASNGWLDRFKKRKSIVFSRVHKRQADNFTDEINNKENACNNFMQTLEGYEQSNIFAIDEIGLLYRLSPANILEVKGKRCSGGVMAKDRLTVLFCANMTGLEKFPLLVVGRYNRPSSFRQVKCLPVQYVANKHAWITMETFNAWLQDLDSWFVQQGRKVLLLVPFLPVHQQVTQQLRTINLLSIPQNVVSPFRGGVVEKLKRHYRRSVLETLIALFSQSNVPEIYSKKDKLSKLSLLSTLHLLSSAWDAITDVAISNDFQRSGFTKYPMWGMGHSETSLDLGTGNIELLEQLRHLGLNIPNITFEDFVHFDDNVQVCSLMDDEDILVSVMNQDKESDASNDEQEPEEQPASVPTTQDVEEALKILRQYIQFQEGAQEMFRYLAQLEYLIYRSGNPSEADGKLMCYMST